MSEGVPKPITSPEGTKSPEAVQKFSIIRSHGADGVLSANTRVERVGIDEDSYGLVLEFRFPGDPQVYKARQKDGGWVADMS